MAYTLEYQPTIYTVLTEEFDTVDAAIFRAWQMRDKNTGYPRLIRNSNDTPVVNEGQILRRIKRIGRGSDIGDVDDPTPRQRLKRRVKKPDPKPDPPKKKKVILKRRKI